MLEHAHSSPFDCAQQHPRACILTALAQQQQHALWSQAARVGHDHIAGEHWLMFCDCVVVSAAAAAAYDDNGDDFGVFDGDVLQLC